MIGHDHVDSERSGAPHHLTCANARIYAHDQRHALRRSALDHFGPHAVPFRKTVRYMEKGRAAGQFDGFLEHDYRGGSVHVIITVNEDLLAGADGGAKPLDSLWHAEHAKRIVELVEGRMEEKAGGVRVTVTPAV